MSCKASLLAVLLVVLRAFRPVALSTTEPEELVQLLAGTDLSDTRSNGNTLPQVKLPWGFNDWVPHTAGPLTDNPFSFNTRSPYFAGMKCSHQPSPWLGDWGYFRITPRTSPAGGALSPQRPQGDDLLEYSPRGSTWRPYLFKTELGRRGGAPLITFKLAPTNHAAFAYIFFHDSVRQGTVFVSAPDSVIDVEGALVKGYTTTHHGALPDNFRMHFVIAASKPPLSWERNTGFDGERGIILSFGDSPGEVTLRMATSLISAEQAELNLHQETDGKSLFDVASEGRRLWSHELQRVSVDMETKADLTVFYTNLWKSMLFPRFLQETDKDGNEVHYSPFDGKVSPGKLVTDSGFWDAYHTVYPMHSVLFPERLGQFMDGWVNAFKENGWLPTWPSPGNREEMVGTMGDVPIADAIVKSEAGGFSFDRETAYEAIRRDAFEMSKPTDPRGRRELEEYARQGYVHEAALGDTSLLVGQPSRQPGVGHRGLHEEDPQPLRKVNSPVYPLHPDTRKVAMRATGDGDHFETVSRTLNDAVADAAVSHAAKMLGRDEDAVELSRRSRRASSVLFNNNTKFFQPRDPGGRFVSSFKPIAWRNGFTEGNAYHYRFYLPHDVDLLQEMFEGKLCDAIKEDLESTSPPAYDPGGYRAIIHEMTEHQVVQAQFGQYNHCNQPAHEVLWVAKKAGCDGIADKFLRRVMDTLYTAYGWCGDEDNGEMSAWFVLSALGIYSLEAGKDEMVLGSPAVTRASVRLPEGRGNLTVIAENQSKENVYVQSVTWTPDGAEPVAIKGNVIEYSKLMSGGTLMFHMGGSPRVQLPVAAPPADPPPGGNARLARRLRGQASTMEPREP